MALIFWIRILIPLVSRVTPKLKENNWSQHAWCRQIFVRFLHKHIQIKKSLHIWLVTSPYGKYKNTVISSYYAWNLENALPNFPFLFSYLFQFQFTFQILKFSWDNALMMMILKFSQSNNTNCPRLKISIHIIFLLVSILILFFKSTIMVDKLS